MNRDLSHKRVLVTPTSFGKKDRNLRSMLDATVGESIYNTTGRPLTADDLVTMIKDVNGFIAGLDEISAPVIEAATQLKVISRYGSGFDRIDLEAANKQGIVVTNTPGANSVAVAELAISFILALARNLCQGNEMTHQGEWPRMNGVGMRGKTVGLVGFGSIGREVAVRLRNFGCRILAADPAVTRSIANEFGVEIVSFEGLLAQSDFVSLHAPATPSTIGMINHHALQRMKPGTFLINTARGELIDETALKETLETGHLGGVALDVFTREPLSKDHYLHQFPQVILTPHTGAHTDDAMNQMGWISMQNCLSVLRGERPRYVVNPEVYSGR